MWSIVSPIVRAGFPVRGNLQRCTPLEWPETRCRDRAAHDARSGPADAAERGATGASERPTRAHAATPTAVTRDACASTRSTSKRPPPRLGAAGSADGLPHRFAEQPSSDFKMVGAEACQVCLPASSPVAGEEVPLPIEPSQTCGDPGGRHDRSLHANWPHDDRPRGGGGARDLAHVCIRVRTHRTDPVGSARPEDRCAKAGDHASSGCGSLGHLRGSYRCTGRSCTSVTRQLRTRSQRLLDASRRRCGRRSANGACSRCCPAGPRPFGTTRRRRA